LLAHWNRCTFYTRVGGGFRRLKNLFRHPRQFLSIAYSIIGDVCTPNVVGVSSMIFSFIFFFHNVVGVSSMIFSFFISLSYLDKYFTIFLVIFLKNFRPFSFDCCFLVVSLLLNFISFQFNSWFLIRIYKIF